MPSFRRGLPEQRAWRQPSPLIDDHLSPPLSGCSDAAALKLHTQALNLVDQVEHHGMALQIGLEIQLQAADAAYTRQFFAAEAPCGLAI